MVNGEGWLAGGVKCPLTVVPCLNYNRHHYDSTVELLSRGLSVEVSVAEGGDIDLTEVVSAYIKHTAKEEFFVGEEFDRMMGTGYVRSMITLGYTAEEIEGVWRSDAERFATQCKPYLIYEN